MGAAANRIKNLAEGLQKKGNEITVICPLPNYPKGKIFKKFKNKFSAKQVINNITVKRYWIFPSKSKNTFIRLISMLSFAWSLWFSIFNFLRKKPDVFIINSPPLLVALSALILSKFSRSKTILNVSDIWPLSALELGVVNRGLFYSFLEKIERVNYKLADKIIGQSEETIIHVSKIVNKDFLVYRNAPKYKNYSLKEKSTDTVKLVYAGLLGYAQGLLSICKELDFKKMGTELHIYGAGMEEDEIMKIAKNQDKNIFMHGVKSSSEIKDEIKKYDVSIVPLKTNIYGAVPSKIFESMQLGMPIIYVGDGEASDIILKLRVGLVSSPNNYKELERNIIKIIEKRSILLKEYSENCIKYHENEYNLENQMRKIIKFID